MHQVHQASQLINKNRTNCKERTLDKNVILFGNNYYPYYHTKDEVLADLKKMKKAGFNQLRTAEALTSWDRIEPKEG
jgi:beta-galactosidase GanA